MLNFTTKLRGAVSSLKDGRYQHKPNASGLLEVIINKLPSVILSRWDKQVVKAHPDYLTLQDFIPWLNNIVKGEMVINHGRSDDGPSKDSKQGRQNSGRSHQIFPTSISTPVVTSESQAKLDIQVRSTNYFCQSCPETQNKLADC